MCARAFFRLQTGIPLGICLRHAPISARPKDDSCGLSFRVRNVFKPIKTGLRPLG